MTNKANSKKSNILKIEHGRKILIKPHLMTVMFTEYYWDRIFVMIVQVPDHYLLVTLRDLRRVYICKMQKSLLNRA